MKYKWILGLVLVLGACVSGPTVKEQKLLALSQGLEAWFLEQMPSWQGQDFMVLGTRHQGLAFTTEKLLFYYHPKPSDPDPQTVVVAGDFQGWRPQGPEGSMTRQSPRRIWTYERPSAPDLSLDPAIGGHVFKFVVDGEWTDPPGELWDLGVVQGD